MKVISLYQPWATLASGYGGKAPVKRVETRSWHTDYRGPLAIHSTKGMNLEARMICGEEPFKSALARYGVSRWDLPKMEILAVVKLIDCLPVEHVRDVLTNDELAFGDYSNGRYAWLFDNVVWIPRRRVQMPGHQKIWNCPTSNELGLDLKLCTYARAYSWQMRDDLCCPPLVTPLQEEKRNSHHPPSCEEGGSIINTSLGKSNSTQPL